MGNLGEAMKKLLFILITFVSVLKADESVTILKEYVCRELPWIQGWCSQEKAENFIDLILEVKPDVCVEIGIYGGSSIFPAASALKFLGKGTLIGIDPWDKFECIKYYDPVEDEVNLKWWGSLNLDYIHYTYVSMLKKYKLEEYVKTIKETSEKAISHIESIDILYIDGNHSEIASIRDVELYLPKVRSGGYIWYNDSIWPERQEGLDLLSEACEVVKLIDDGNCILFQKR